MVSQGRLSFFLHFSYSKEQTPSPFIFPSLPPIPSSSYIL